MPRFDEGRFSSLHTHARGTHCDGGMSLGRRGMRHMSVAPSGLGRRAVKSFGSTGERVRIIDREAPAP